MQLLIALLGPIILLKAAANVLGWAHRDVQVRLLMAFLGPIIFLGAAAYVLGWAHFNAHMQL